MSDDGENTQENSALFSDEASTSDFFIDDYSHLRLSYHRDIDESDVDDEITEDEVETSDENDNSDDETDIRQRLREYWISQMPDLPHPAVTMASIISSASQKMGMVNLEYNDRIEPGYSVQEDEKRQTSPQRFSPEHRSTLNCKSLPK